MLNLGKEVTNLIFIRQSSDSSPRLAAEWISGIKVEAVKYLTQTISNFLTVLNRGVDLGGVESGRVSNVGHQLL